jgi:CheY-like chemotaxis protein
LDILHVMKFLIVDDSLAMQAIIKRSLKKAGYIDNQYQLAEDGLQALEIIESWKPDVVITDWHMPNMNGIELLEEVKSRGLDLKIGLVTAETSPRMILQAKEAGALFVLHKPFDIDELQKTVIPIVQGSVESQKILSNLPSYDGRSGYDLQLPSIPALKKIASGFNFKDLEIVRSNSTDINYTYLPYVIVLFNGADKKVTRAMSILDIRAAAILSCTFDVDPAASASESIRNKMLTKKQLSRIKKIMSMISALFYDPLTQEGLEAKSVHMIPKPFDRLDKLGETSRDKRIDLTISSKGLGEGQVIFMSGS